ncbi:MAG: redoxin domain-containing protein [Chloroflexi bacterium]|nr:redoxin domain-containing protein [Chloroflexota bacterium]
MGANIGDTAPDFHLYGTKDADVRLSDLKGKKNVLLVFYPGDDTPG